MSNNQEQPNFSDRQKASDLHICLFSPDENIAQAIKSKLTEDYYILREIKQKSDLIEFITNQKEQIDCLVFVDRDSEQNLLNQLKKLGIILPAVIVNLDDSDSNSKVEANKSQSSAIYHSAEIQVEAQKITNIASQINFAITQFLKLAPSCSLVETATQAEAPAIITEKADDELVAAESETTKNFLRLQQRRLAEKLQERLGYLGVYYKRNSRDFYRNLQESQKQELIEDLNHQYRQVILVYFDDNSEINQLIDDFVNQAFFADISISQILEMHMELMDEFAQQLKLEGRSEEILLDYRLALIDIIAHLCEMYRRSIPREEIPLDMLFRVDE